MMMNAPDIYLGTKRRKKGFMGMSIIISHSADSERITQLACQRPIIEVSEKNENLSCLISTIDGVKH